LLSSLPVMTQRLVKVLPMRLACLALWLVVLLQCKQVCLDLPLTHNHPICLLHRLRSLACHRSWAVNN
jgi:hypothetical protein